jgi:hypothetical protein
MPLSGDDPPTLGDAWRAELTAPTSDSAILSVICRWFDAATDIAASLRHL